MRKYPHILGVERAEDSAHTSGDLGYMALGVRKDTAASLAGTDGDYTAPIFNSTGHQWVVDPSTAGSAASLALLDDALTPVAPATATATKGLLQGAQYNSTLPTFTNGQQGSRQVGSRGSGNVTLFTQDTDVALRALATDSDALATTSSVNSFAVVSHAMQFDETDYERIRGNTAVTMFASAARTASPTAVELTNYNARGLHLVINVTAITATPSITVTIRGGMASGATTYAMLTSAAITATGTTVLRIYPGLTAVANLVANDILPRIWRVTVTHADADSITYGIDASLVL